MRPEFSLHHGGISVQNLEQSITFYSNVLGFEVDTKTVVNDGFIIIHLKQGDTYIELFWMKEQQALPEHAKTLYSDLPVIGTKHLGFVTPDIKAMYQWLLDNNVEVMSEIMTNNTDYDYFFFKDPNGILLEMVEHKHHA